MPIEVDYLVKGAGAVGLAFVDTLLSESDCTVAMADRRDAPGGHWNDAYPFVALHAPSIFYGVPSRPFGDDVIETSGFNAGHRELASKPAILDYYDRLLRERFLASGRVRWFPRHVVSEHDGGPYQLDSLVTGRRQAVSVRRRLVDGTRSDVQIPATHRPDYRVQDGLSVIPPGELVRLAFAPKTVCVVGAGKTAMDACLWLLAHDVAPERIRWIKPREALVLDREITRDFATFLGAATAQLRAMAQASSFGDFIARIERSGVTQVDPGHPATQFRGAMLARREIEALRKITDVVRLGHVTAIEDHRIVLENGVIPTDPHTLYIDCSAYGHHEAGLVPVFEEGRINLQLVRAGEPLFSAAFIAFVETALGDDAARNAVCSPVPLPSRPIDLLRTTMVTLGNVARWMKHGELLRWAGACRLSQFTALDGRRAQDPSDPLMQAFAEAAMAAAPALPALISDAERVGLG